jgi:hypothetical protein
MRCLPLGPETADDARLGMLGERADSANTDQWPSGLACFGPSASTPRAIALHGHKPGQVLDFTRPDYLNNFVAEPQGLLVSRWYHTLRWRLFAELD